MRHSSPVKVGLLSERFRVEAGRRAAGIFAALVLEALLLLLLLSLGQSKPPPGKRESLVSFTASEPAAEPAPEPSATPEPQTQQRPVTRPPEPPEPQPVQPQTVPPPRAVIPTPREQPRSADVYPRPIQQVPPGRPVSGPPDTGSPASGDTARVGTAPNGEPLYAAAWYREPYPDELSGYLSTASGPGWGLIACRTAPDYRVEDCVGLAEYPQGSQFLRAILAAAWQFKVRPPRLGGRPLVGAWVRIRITQTVEGRGAPSP